MAPWRVGDRRSWRKRPLSGQAVPVLPDPVLHPRVPARGPAVHNIPGCFDVGHPQPRRSVEHRAPQQQSGRVELIVARSVRLLPVIERVQIDSRADLVLTQDAELGKREIRQ